MSLLKGVYWDLDGTIANTELEAHLPAFNNAFNDFDLGWHWNKSTYIKLLKINGGKNRIEYYSKTRNDSITLDLIKRIHQRKQYHYLKKIKDKSIKLKTGVYRLVNELYENKVRQFIVTSSSKIQANLIIKYLFQKYSPFEFIISSDDVLSHKPNPLPYLQAMKISGIEKKKSIVFEDSSPGLRSSLAAEIPTIYIPSNIPLSIDRDIVFDGHLDTLGNESLKTNVIKGPHLENQFVDHSYLEKFLHSLFYAKN